MLSCDTFALCREYYNKQLNLLAKNSDRPLGEAQPACYFPAADHEQGERLQCTHLNIPQASHTYAVLGGKPYWIWGFEMGINEKGLAIGNEAEGSRCPAEKEDGLLGMDILRLALERAATASEAINVIAELLKAYGQNANASMLFDRRYENTFIISDPDEVWVMDTAGREWAARKVKDWTAVSNCYTVEKQIDRCSEDAERLARENRWLRPGEDFDFAKAYTLPAIRQTQSVPRWNRQKKLISSYVDTYGKLNDKLVRSVLRDHYEGEVNTPRYSGFSGGPSICMHAYSWDASQTAGAMLFSTDPVLGHIISWAPSLPCCSVFIPIYFSCCDRLPKQLSSGDGAYSSSSLWWTVEKLAMAISADDERFAPKAISRLRELEAAVDKDKEETEARAAQLMGEGETDAALELLAQLTARAAQALQTVAKDLTASILRDIRLDGGLYGPRKEFLEDYAKRSGMEF